MINPSDKKLPIRKQAKLPGINRSRLATRQTRTTEEDRKIMTIMDELYMERPFYGQRRRKRVRQLMRVMGIEALVPKPSTSVPARGHEIAPYLRRNRAIDPVDEVWRADINYLPMENGHPIWWRLWIGVAVRFWRGRPTTP